MSQVQSIELVLENLESFQVKREHIGVFSCLDISKSIIRMAINSIEEVLFAKEFFLQISSEANHFESFDNLLPEDEHSPFKRLTQRSDITALVVCYDNGKTEEIHLVWGGNLEHKNTCQTCEVNPHTGDLYLAISEKETVSSYFSTQLSEKKASYWKRGEES